MLLLAVVVLVVGVVLVVVVVMVVVVLVVAGRLLDTKEAQTTQQRALVPASVFRRVIGDRLGH